MRCVIIKIIFLTLRPVVGVVYDSLQLNNHYTITTYYVFNVDEEEPCGQIKRQPLILPSSEHGSCLYLTTRIYPDCDLE